MSGPAIEGEGATREPSGRGTGKAHVERRRPLVLLKARPTAAQLANRLAPPVPDGVELYIHEDDVSGDDWQARLRAALAPLRPPPQFTWIVEGPVWSLDGALFGLCRNAEVDRELTRRLVQLAVEVGAPAVNIHCVAGSPDAGVLSEAHQRDALERALPFLHWYAALCRDAGVIPLVENVPPICRMRRAAFIYTPIGVEAQDLADCARAVPGLRMTLDLSHAQLAVNAFTGAAPAGLPDEQGGEGLRQAAQYYRGRGSQSLDSYMETVLPWIVGVHVSNAAGLLEEGLPYDRGDADLDRAVCRLAGAAHYFVTEPLDTNEEEAPLKREIQRRLVTLLRPNPNAARG